MGTAKVRTVKSRIITLLALVALAIPLVAHAEPQGGNVATPDERVDVTVEGEQTGPESGYLNARGNAGAYHFDNTVEAGSEGFRVTNPPMWGALGTNGEEFPELYGPPVARAALGVGSLTANFKHTGVLSGLNWPGPGFYDHVNYLHRTRGWENGGAAENAGSFAGLVLPDTFERQVTWFTEVEGWTPVEQAYDGERSGVLRTELANDDFPGTAVVIRDVVHPETDVLARDIEVLNPPEGARLAYYANMNPTTGRAPRTPSITDALVDDASDFATTYDEAAGAMLHFRPYRLDPAAATAAATSRLDPEIAQAAIERTVGADGVHIAIASDQPTVGFQAGVDAAGLARDEVDGSPLADPYYDAADGSLSGSTAAIGKTAGAQVWDATSATVYISAAGTSDEALAAVDEAEDVGFASIGAAADADWNRWLTGVRLPRGGDAETRAVSTRALMLIRTATDRQTGAIVANTTTQTPYRQDWLRDGAFFNYALLLAGTDDAVEMVQAHNDFYVRHQSETGHWDPILCTDGAHCDAAFPFEIDAQAFGVWSLWMEYEFTENLPRGELRGDQEGHRDPLRVPGPHQRAPVLRVRGRPPRPQPGPPRGRHRVSRSAVGRGRGPARGRSRRRRAVGRAGRRAEGCRHRGLLRRDLRHGPRLHDLARPGAGAGRRAHPEHPRPAGRHAGGADELRRPPGRPREPGLLPVPDGADLRVGHRVAARRQGRAAARRHRVAHP